MGGVEDGEGEEEGGDEREEGSEEGMEGGESWEETEREGVFEKEDDEGSVAGVSSIV